MSANAGSHAGRKRRQGGGQRNGLGIKLNGGGPVVAEGDGRLAMNVGVHGRGSQDGVDGMIGQILKPMNRYAIPRLLRLNGVKTTDPPKIVATTAGRIDLEKVGVFLSNLGAAGLQVPNDPKFMKQLFEAAGLGSDFEFPPAPKPVEPVAPKPEPEKPDPEKPEPSELQKTDGQVLEVGPALAARAKVLSGSLDREITGLLQELGSRAASAYLGSLQKAERPSKREVRALVAKVVRSLGIAGWVQQRLMPALRNHAGRVARDVERTLLTEVGLETKVADADVQRIARAPHFTARDIEPQVRAAILKAVEEGLAKGDNPQRTADRIRKSVPAGRFTKAGSGYRSQLIAQDQTGAMMYEASLAAYRSNPNVTAIKLRDGIYGPPRSDSFCIGRDGDVVPLSEAPARAHPRCTLGATPVVQTPEADLVPA